MSGVWILEASAEDELILRMLGVNLTAHTFSVLKAPRSESIDFNFLSHQPFVLVETASETGTLSEPVDLLLISAAQNEQALTSVPSYLKQGAKSVLITDICLQEGWSYEYWTNGNESFWLSTPRAQEQQKKCLATALSAFVALGYSLKNAIVLAKMFQNFSSRLQSYAAFSKQQIDLPYLAAKPLLECPTPFLPAANLGLYPVVDSYAWVETLINAGVKTIQLRIKGKPDFLEKEIKASIDLAKKHQVLLYINDHWELALKFNAQAVHLGQEDLDSADLQKLLERQMQLGVSTYCEAEVARAHAICPSYIAIGPIYATQSKALAIQPQGIEGLSDWCQSLDYPLVAIGGIDLTNIEKVLATGVDGVALISAITKASNPLAATKALLNSFTFVKNLDMM